jgi:hypothetical protein
MMKKKKRRLRALLLTDFGYWMVSVPAVSIRSEIKQGVKGGDLSLCTELAGARETRQDWLD